MIKQDYEIGAETTLSTHAQLSVADAEWQWIHRTLIGFEDEDGHFIESGGKTTFHTQTAEVSGVWILDKSQYPVKIYAIGSSGQIQVAVKEINRELPLGNSSHPFEKTVTSILTSNEEMYNEIYWQSNNSKLSIHVSAAPGCTIKSFKCGDNTVFDHVEPYENILSTIYWGTNNNSIYISLNGQSSNALGLENVYKYGISVDFVEGGVLTYDTNKTNLNPRHPDLNS